MCVAHLLAYIMMCMIGVVGSTGPMLHLGLDPAEIDGIGPNSWAPPGPGAILGAADVS